jgi:hypothetical protein
MYLFIHSCIAFVINNLNVFVQVDKLPLNAEVSSVFCLKAYLLLLLGFVLFNYAHGDIVDKVLLSYAHIIADVDCVPFFSWGFAVLAATYRSLCKASARLGTNSNPRSPCYFCCGRMRGSISANSKWTTFHMTHPPWAPLVQSVVKSLVQL